MSMLTFITVSLSPALTIPWKCSTMWFLHLLEILVTAAALQQPHWPAEAREDTEIL